MSRKTGLRFRAIHFGDMRLLIVVAAWIACNLAMVSSFQAHAAARQSQPAPSKRQIVKRVEPSYPAVAQRAGLKGSVRLLLRVGPGGSVTSVQVLGGNPFFIESATEAVNSWRWAQASTESKEIVQITFGNP
jgi:TonB family protein